MLPARAANGNGKVAAIIGYKAGQPALYEIADVAQHLLRIGSIFQEFDDRCIAPGERLQQRIVVRIGQAAHIEYQIGVQRNAVLVSERLEQQCQTRAVHFDELLDPVAQRIGIEFGGVDVVADVADFGEQFTLVADAFRKCTDTVTERVQAACLGKAFYQGIVLGIQEQHMHVHALLLDLLQQWR